MDTPSPAETCRERPPGWYVDPTFPLLWRWRSGVEWTAHTFVEPPASQDQRQRLLGRIALSAVGAAMFLSFATFPFVYGEPPEGKRKVVPHWTLVVGIVVLIAWTVAIVAAAAWLIRRRCVTTRARPSHR